MTLTQLKYLISLEEYGSFLAAAEACRVTQPTLSMQIQKLEDELGVRLIDRSVKPLRPTPIGEQIIEEARKAIHQTRKIESLAHLQQGALSGKFRLGVIPTLAPYVLPLFLESFLQNYPDVELFVEELQTPQIVTLLEKNRLDAGLMATPIEGKSLREQEVFTEPFLIYLGKGHALTSKKEIKKEELPKEGLLVLKEGHCMREQTFNICDSHREHEFDQQRFHFQSGSIETILKLVDQGQGFTLIPALCAQQMTRTKREQSVRPFFGKTPSRQVGLVFHEIFGRERIVSALADTIRESIPSFDVSSEFVVPIS